MKPILIDGCCCGGGASRGYNEGGYEVYGIDNDPKRLRDYPYPYLVMDIIEALVRWQQGEGLTFSDGRTIYLADIAMIHCSPPCQGYSIMNNLPWIRSRTYPMLILSLRELLNGIGLPYVIENVAGARFGAKGLVARGLQEHGMKAGWLCGGMFGLPIYRHRYFETNWFWPMPGHPKHVRTKQPESSFSPRPRGSWEQGYEETKPGASPQAVAVRRGLTASPPMAGHSPGNAFASYVSNGAQKEGVAVGHAAGWRVAAEAMGIDWMRRSELTQAIPPVMTAYLARWSPPILAQITRGASQERE